LENPLKSRKLIIDTNIPGTQIVIIRAADRGRPMCSSAPPTSALPGATCSWNTDGHDLYELLDLKIARLPADGGRTGGACGARRPKILDAGARATKYVNITRRHFAAKGIQTDIIKLYGSMELAPLVGLSGSHRGPG